MNKSHQELLIRIQESSGVNKRTWGAGYLGSNHLYYSLSSPLRRQLAKDWARQYKNITAVEFLSVLDDLFKGKSYEEKTIAPRLLEYLPKQRFLIEPAKIDLWLDDLQGWAEVDSLCQGIFSDKELLGNWKKWELLLKKLNESDEVSKRRASLVLLTGPLSHSDDPRMADLAFANINNLKEEKDILITKAISWLLRSLIKNHRSRVEEYLRKNQDTLPKIAVREVRRKLLTGRK